MPLLLLLSIFWITGAQGLMILVDLDSLYKAEDMEEIHKYLLWETNVLPSKFPNCKTMTIYILSISHCKSSLKPSPPPPASPHPRLLYSQWKSYCNLFLSEKAKSNSVIHSVKLSHQKDNFFAEDLFQFLNLFFYFAWLLIGLFNVGFLINQISE